MASDREQQEHSVALLDSPHAEVEAPYTTDGSLDFNGNPALKHRTGGWRACRSVLGTEFCYCLAFYGISCNLVTYLTTVLGESNVAAAKSVSTWHATCFLMPLAGAVVADSFWGRYRTMVVSCFISVAGMLMTAFSAYLPLLVKNTALFTGSNMVSAQELVLFLGLYMIAFGLGGLRPCLMSFGADQFDDGDPSERKTKGSFFNWYMFNMSCASVMSSTAVVWVQDHYGWELCLTIPAVVLAVGLSCFISVAGMLMTAFSAYLPLLVKNTALFTGSNMVSAQELVLFLGLYMIAFGLGGLRPCLMSFGADQFDDGDPSERKTKGSFFNWYMFNMSCASVMSSTAVVWVQDHYGWELCLTIPAVVLAVGLSCLVAASRAYRFQRTRGSPLTRFCQVVVAAVCKFNVEPPADNSLLYELPEDEGAMKGVRRIEHTTDLQFFDKAAIVAASDKDAEEASAPARRDPWRLCSVTQVEELKILVRMLPLWATIVFFNAVSAQVTSTFVEQGMAMDTTVGSIRVPPAAMSTFDVLTIVVLVPLYDRAFVPAARRLTGREKGISELQRIGAGLAMSVLAMAAAALLETERLRAAKAAPLAPPGTSLLWQVPQFVLMGVGGVLTTVGQLDFFYSQGPAAMKTVCVALGFLAGAAGGYLSWFLLAAVEWATTKDGGAGWIPDDLNEGHLDRFFWMMAGLGCLNLMAFLSCATRYKSRKNS